MDKIKLNCTFDNNDYMTMDYLGKKLGIDLYEGSKPVGGVLLNHKQIESMIEFLQTILDESK